MFFCVKNIESNVAIANELSGIATHKKTTTQNGEPNAITVAKILAKKSDAFGLNIFIRNPVFAALKCGTSLYMNKISYFKDNSTPSANRPLLLRLQNKTNVHSGFRQSWSLNTRRNPEGDKFFPPLY